MINKSHAVAAVLVCLAGAAGTASAKDFSFSYGAHELNDGDSRVAMMERLYEEAHSQCRIILRSPGAPLRAYQHCKSNMMETVVGRIDDRRFTALYEDVETQLASR